MMDQNILHIMHDVVSLAGTSALERVNKPRTPAFVTDLLLG